MTSRAHCHALHAAPAVLPERAPTGFRHALGELVIRVADAVLAWQERAQQRYHLEALDQRMLKDIGLSRADVERETGRVFWR